MSPKREENKNWNQNCNSSQSTIENWSKLYLRGIASGRAEWGEAEHNGKVGK